MINTRYRIKNVLGFTPHHLFRTKPLNGLLEKDKSGGGFTLIELLTIVAVLIILTLVAVLSLRSFQKESDLTNTTEEIINILRFAQNKTLASEGASQWGVYFSTSTTPHQYTLFKGESYALRDTSADETYKLPEQIEIYGVDLAEEGQEVIFNRVVGTTNQSGAVFLRLKTDISKTRQVVIKSSGKITSAQETAPGDEDRIKDSRHVHFDYSRQIPISTETLKLIFTYNASSITQNVVIANNLRNGQIYWEGGVNVDGEIQQIKIHTHALNHLELNTQFCVHRDRRYNTKALKIEIDGDGSGYLIQYTADGQTAQGTSIYVSSPIWQ